jgi:hypothetical protein
MSIGLVPTLSIGFIILLLCRCLGGVNLSFDFSHPPKLLRIRLMPFENAVFGVKNAILGIIHLIKPCNQSGNSFIKNKPKA